MRGFLDSPRDVKGIVNSTGHREHMARCLHCFPHQINPGGVPTRQGPTGPSVCSCRAPSPVLASRKTSCLCDQTPECAPSPGLWQDIVSVVNSPCARSISERPNSVDRAPILPSLLTCCVKQIPRNFPSKFLSVSLSQIPDTGHLVGEDKQRCPGFHDGGMTPFLGH